jgi:hypothetical protein
MTNEDNILESLLAEISGLLTDFPQALERQAAILHAGGKEPELAEKLAKAADTMRDSGNLYITWARHYVAMSKGNTDASTEEDESEDFDI